MSFNDYLENHLSKIGIKNEDYVFDFGCGEGNYSIPVAKIVGRKGRIFAVDENISKLEQLEIKVKNYGLSGRFHIINTTGKFNFPLENETIDITLLYNVTCCILGKDDFKNFKD